VSCKRKSDLRRHEATAHHGDKIYWCPVLGCSRSAEQTRDRKPFPRKDKRNEHVRRVHGVRDDHQACLSHGEKSFEQENPMAFTPDAAVARPCAEVLMSDAACQLWPEPWNPLGLSILERPVGAVDFSSNYHVAVPKLDSSIGFGNVDINGFSGDLTPGGLSFPKASEATYDWGTKMYQDMFIGFDGPYTSSYNGELSLETRPSSTTAVVGFQTYAITEFDSFLDSGIL
jgi:hypothetical protein